MKIAINDNRKIYSLQDEFNNQFPFLKIEFYSRLHKPEVASPESQMKNQLLSLGEFRTLHNSGELNITPEMTVNELEKAFKYLYGLSVQVFRRSGRIWLESTVTESWTLEKQNKEGELLSSLLPKPVPPDDYHEPE